MANAYTKDIRESLALYPPPQLAIESRESKRTASIELYCILYGLQECFPITDLLGDSSQDSLEGY